MQEEWYIYIDDADLGVYRSTIDSDQRVENANYSVGLDMWYDMSVTTPITAPLEWHVPMVF